MTEPVNIQTGIKAEAPVPSQTPKGLAARIKAAMPPKVTDILHKFYSNKKIFLPVVISLGLVFFVVIIGLIFGNPGGSGSAIVKKPSPTAVPVQSPGMQNPTETTRLEELKSQLNNLDIEQKRLSPPKFEYKISF